METKQKVKKPKSKEYPACSFDDAISFVEKLKNYPVRQPITYSIAAKEHGFASVNTKSFKYRLSAAKQFGLLTTASGETLILTDWAYDLVMPTKSKEEIDAIKLQCFQNPKLYAELLNSYEGKSLPPQSTLENLLVQSYGIVPSVKEVAAKTFRDSAIQAGAVTVSGVLSTENRAVSECVSVEQSTTNNNVDNKNGDIHNDNGISSIIGEKRSTDLNLETLIIPLGNQRKIILQYPFDISENEAKFTESIIAQSLKYASGENK